MPGTPTSELTPPRWCPLCGLPAVHDQISVTPCDPLRANDDQELIAGGFATVSLLTCQAGHAFRAWVRFERGDRVQTWHVEPARTG